MWRTNGLTNRLTDLRTDIPSYRAAKTHLKGFGPKCICWLIRLTFRVPFNAVAAICLSFSRVLFLLAFFSSQFMDDWWNLLTLLPHWLSDFALDFHLLPSDGEQRNGKSHKMFLLGEMTYRRRTTLSARPLTHEKEVLVRDMNASTSNSFNP